MCLLIVSFISLFFVVLLQLVSAAPALENLKNAKISKRQGSQDLSFCFGENAICSVGNDLYAQCGNYEGTQLYKCICGNGYVSVEDACYWCQLAYNLDIAYNGPSNKDGCSSAGVSIAPIPSSVLALEASYNQTYTGIISGAASATTGPPASVAASSTDSAQLALTSKASLSTHHTIGSPSNNAVNSNTYFGGVTSVVTLNGGNQGTTTAALISNTGNLEATATSAVKAGSGAGGALGWTTGTAVMLSVVAFGFSILCLL